MSSVSINNMIFNLYIFKRCFQLKSWQRHVSHFIGLFMAVLRTICLRDAIYVLIEFNVLCLSSFNGNIAESFIPPTWWCFVYIIITSSSTKYLSMPLFVAVIVVAAAAAAVIMHAFKKTICNMIYMVNVMYVTIAPKPSSRRTAIAKLRHIIIAIFPTFSCTYLI